mmetsp:Transcript_55563/g.154796  ORF Transcript_55563/g.154796 Transcript_55563/m.154796 type:complete len:239 (+) Transcript_55563:72-788(+)|eukprot:CAMPEP_0117559438 /NCGR_PEP_ID=MMETSP0784-20121206/53364_1 /TAXON_ID=39447 /ORGANISM="" /LENGTH=238 /DNA_ID=CAMNT_0005356823 /DNA_START=72 /DNA_END=788 /DNA_ORIENTATION=+
MGWLPLESNPEVLNPFVRRLGLPPNWEFCDVFGLDDELLAMVPQPCVALCLLFPSTNISRARREELRGKLGSQPAPPPKLFFMQQHDGIGNACGTIALIHAVANSSLEGAFALESGGALAPFLATAAPLGVSDRGWRLTEATELQELSDATAAAGETAGAGTDDAQDQHFICFTHVGGMLYELDGRSTDESGVAFPFCHGPTTAETFVADAAKVIKEDFMARDPENLNFNITALCKQE